MKQNKYRPPRLARKFLRWFLREELAEEVEGDLSEQFRLAAFTAERRIKEIGIRKVLGSGDLNIVMCCRVILPAWSWPPLLSLYPSAISWSGAGLKILRTGSICTGGNSWAPD